MSFTPWVVLALHHLAVGLMFPAPSVRIEREAWLMGTRFHLVIEGVGRAAADRLGESVLREVERLDALLDTWDPETPLSRINRAVPGTATTVPEELDGLLRESTHWARATSGAFEPRIGALVDAWDLRGPGRTPRTGELALALAWSGPTAIVLSEQGLTRSSDMAWIDTGGFGKGAALRAAGLVLAGGPENGPPRAMLDLGGQILALGPPGTSWTVHVAHPVRRLEAAATLSVHDRSVSTSGGSERGRHVLDPRTGRPVDPWGSVTVVDVDALAADALSTALYVMGPRVGLAWARNAGVAALFLEVVEDTVDARWTQAMEPWLVETPTAATALQPLNRP